MNRPFAPLFILVCLSLSLIACGGGSSSTPPPPPPAISVSFSTAPPTPMGLGATASIAVTVSNDSANAGVTWSCTPTNSCGSFNPTSTASGATTIYTAPATVPASGSVTITAKSVTDGSKTASSNVTITGPAITIAISTAPPTTLSTGSPNNTAVIAATTNDGAGVNWTCTPANVCGSFNPTSTLTTATTVYTAPAAVPSGSHVTIIATSVTDGTKSAQATVSITGTASLATLKGQYAFLVLSPTGSRGTAAWVGSVNLDGAGNLTAVGTTGFAGVEDVVAPTRNDQGDNVYPTATNSASKYTVDASGHGQITMATVRGEVLIISFVITAGNSSGVATHAEIIEADDNRGEAGDPGSGTLDLQNSSAFSTSQISGAYSFVVSGVDAIPPYPVISLGGVINVSSSATITGTVDTVSGGTFTPATITQGSIDGNGPDTNGRGTLHFVAPGAPIPSRSFTYYVVTPKVLRVFENSNISFTGGSMYSQGTATTALSGPYVYQHSGWSTAGRTVAAGKFTVTSGSSSFSGGISDANSGGISAVSGSTSKPVSGSYAASTTESGTINITNFMDATGTTASTFNAYPVDPTLNILDPNSSSGGGGALLLHTDANINGTGILLPQASPQVFSANYALNLINAIASTTPNEIDLVGILSSDGAANFAGASDLADYTQASTAPNPQINAPLAGTFIADITNAGRYTGTFSVTSIASATGYTFPTGAASTTAIQSTFSVAIYQATTSQAFVVETDAQAITTGQMVQQNLP